MTVAVDAELRIREYAGDDSANPRAVPFYFLDNDDLTVTRVNADGSETVLVRGSDYTVSGAGNPAGGSVTPLAPIATGTSWRIEGNMPLGQPIDYTEGDDFRAESHERGLDRAMIAHQEARRDIGDLVLRALLAPRGEQGGLLPAADDLLGKFLSKDADGNWIAVDGTGADGALRAQLASAIGAAMVGVAAGVSVETALGNKALAAALGVSGTATDLGTFTGTIVPDNQTAKQAIQALETAGEQGAEQRTRDRRMYASAARMFMPFAEIANVAIGDLFPTATAPVAAMRLHADWEVWRIAPTSLAGAPPPSGIYFDEYLVHKPSLVSSGRQNVLHRAYWDGQFADWNVPIDNPGRIANADFAARLCRQDLPYHSGGEGPAAYYTGPGHERFFIAGGDVQMSHSAKGGNLAGIGNWAVGEKLFGNSGSISLPTMKLAMFQKAYASNPMATTNGSGTVRINDPAHGYSTGRVITLAGSVGFNGIPGSALNGRFSITVVDANNYDITASGSAVANATGAGGGADILMFDDAVALAQTMSFGAAFGRRNTFEFSALIANVGIQDSYFAMFPISHGYASHLKFNGLPEVPIVTDGSVYPTGVHTGSASCLQAYSRAEPRLVKQMFLEFAGADGAATPIRTKPPLPAVNSFPYNRFARGVIVFNSDFAKGYFHSHSSEQGLPRTVWPINVGDAYQCQVSEKTSWLPGGPI